uniref:SWIM-type domain-containing protein n=1 Tax=Chenopodium quinoa TaxID=63459 RepID=A0A803LMA1_CHEQI
MFEERRSKSKSWTSVLAPYAEKQLEEAVNLASSYQALQSDEFEFEVISADRSDIVNIGTHCCSCRYWQLYGIPCSHAVAALRSCKKDPYAFVVKYFTVESFRETYMPKLHPIPRKIELKRPGQILVNEEIQVVRPPKFRRPPGRPEKKRICTNDINREKHAVRCSKCNQTGHYKTTCKVEFAERM